MDYADIPAKFWAKVEKSQDGKDCWPWLGRRQLPAKHTKRGVGYGLFQPTIPAHRLAYELTRGAIPEGLCVMHKCDNPSCVNPQHLVLGTYADNNHDKTLKGRNAMGEKHGMAKLTLTEVQEIRRILAESPRTRPSYSQLAKQFGVTKGAIVWIATGGTWRADTCQHHI